MYLLCIYKDIIDIFGKYLHVYIPINIKYINITYFLKYIHACVCIYIYIINIHGTHTHTYIYIYIYIYIMLTKTFILDAINHLTALIYIYLYIYKLNEICIGKTHISTFCSFLLKTNKYLPMGQENILVYL